MSLLRQSPGRGRALSSRWLYPHPIFKTTTENDLKANIDLQPNERITLELMAKKTVYCERNTVIILSLFFDNCENHDDPGADSEEGGQGSRHGAVQDQAHL